MEEFEVKLDSLKQLLSSQSNQSWLFGAGVSYDSNIPLMYPLTTRVESIINSRSGENEKEILGRLKEDLSDSSHVEHYLSHLGDLLAIAERSRGKKSGIGGVSYSREDLKSLYSEIIKAIGETVRYGYKAGDPDSEIEEVVGTAEEPIVEIDPHVHFIEALSLSQANLERRSRITFFTTNYDTLLEDALGLHKKAVCDGFTGGALGFWNAEEEFSRPIANSATFHVYKLHGSVDWHRDPEHGLLRVRYGTKYLSDPTDIMIYPQATKYVETQKDPFATLFLGLRRTLMHPYQNTLITCGYSFGDNHINAEIEGALKSNQNTTLIAFIKESPDEESGIAVHEVLDRWLSDPKICQRIYVAGESGIYHSSTKPVCEEGKSYNWWRFDGLTEFIKTGELS
ncbi:SIR2 family protein [Salinicola sp. JS01]|uniref:SIR2 family NAD-dependent protein deacylase n=1 Tax=Salinicola sp. JS01 TaxID=3050071 RepID=UPI00255B5752|nr:SIR2 family protein [Salinicola sp. JS01]WIX33927.1 SIR2 family protein [Salinicola sp. JS01]